MPDDNGTNDGGGVDTDAPPPLDLGAINIEEDNAPPPSFGVPNFRETKARKTPLRAVNPRKSTPKRPLPPYRKGQYVGALQNIYTGIGLAIMPVDQYCATVIIESGENCARAIDELAGKNEAVRRAIYALTQTSMMGAVAMAHAPIALAVMGHHMPGFADRFGRVGMRAANEAAARAANEAGASAD